MIKTGGERVTAVRVAKDIILGELEINGDFIDAYVDRDSELTDKEAKDIFDWVEKFRVELAFKWDYDPGAEREFRRR